MIKFERIVWMNMMSFGNYETEVLLDKSNVTIFTGKNGVGKSTFLDALIFALYGSPYRDINKPLLVNTTTNKGLKVTIDFEQDGEKYQIVRGIKPSIFKIFKNGVLIPQDAKGLDYQYMLERDILRCSEKTFTQVVILGSNAYRPFLDLLTLDRRKIIENILDLEIFTIMNSVLKERMATNKDSIATIEMNMRQCQNEIDHYNRLIQTANQLHNDDKAAYQKTIDELTENGKGLRKKYDDIINLKYVSSREEINSLEEKISKLSGLYREYNSEIKKYTNDRDFLNTNDGCYTCLQKITPEHKKTRLNFLIEKIEENKKLSEDTDAERQKLALLLDETKKKQSVYADAEILKQNYVQQMKSISEQIKKWQSLIDKKVEEKAKVDTSGLEKEQTHLLELTQELEALYKVRASQTILGRLLKDDGVKSIEIEKYIDLINELINKYLLALNFPCQFYLDTQFNEIIRSRYRDTFTYKSFSDGQQKRINLAILFAWMEVASRKNSVSTNLLIFDEILDSSLDDEGKEDFYNLLKKLMKDRSIFIMSHNDRFLNWADDIISVEMNGGFSRYWLNKYDGKKE